METPKPKKWRIIRRCVIGLAILATLIVCFYTEELWRGKRAWEEAKRQAEEQGEDFDWSHQIPPAVTQKENVFGVPEMQKWLTDRGATELSKALDYPGFGPAGHDVVVGKIRIGKIGEFGTGVSNVINISDPAKMEKIRALLRNAIGPMVVHPIDTMVFAARPLREIQPAQINLEGDTVPAQSAVANCLPSLGDLTGTVSGARFGLKPSGAGYDLTLSDAGTPQEYVDWTRSLEPKLSILREALKRPSSRMEGDYELPVHIPFPNFITARAFAQTMNGKADCCFLLGKPEEALEAVQLTHTFCRIMTNHPVTLVAAMINVAIEGLNASTISEGLRLHAWREPELVALQKQLKETRILPLLIESLQKVKPSLARTLTGMAVPDLFAVMFPVPDLGNKVAAHLMPRGWIYQNLATMVRNKWPVREVADASNEHVFPERANVLRGFAEEASSGPYSFLVKSWVPNVTKAFRTAALTQTRINQTCIACALERYRLAHGEYPATLDELVPNFLDAVPTDVIGGKAPRYVNNKDGTFLLYSTGWNEKDVPPQPGKLNEDGPWVWPDTVMH